jgi:hypothetical protein
LGGGRRGSRAASASLPNDLIDVFVGRSDDRDQRPDRRSVTFLRQLLPEDTIATGNQIHDRLVGLDLGKHFARFYGVAFVLQPLHEAALFHRRRERLHYNLGSHIVRRGT